MLIIVTSSPRVAPGLLTHRAWEVLRAHPVLVGSPGHPLLPHLAEAGITAETVAPDPEAVARRAAGGVRRNCIAWLSRKVANTSGSPPEATRPLVSPTTW